jgi:hypothetical protein
MIFAHEHVASDLDRHGSFRILAQGQAWDSQEGRLLLDAAGIRDDHGRVAFQRERIQIVQRIPADRAPETVLFSPRLSRLKLASHGLAE